MANNPDPPSANSPVRELFLRALETDDPSARATLIDTACDNDPRMRSEVEALLERSGSVGDFLQKPALATPREPPKIGLSLSGRVASMNEMPGDKIDSYKLLEPLGEGGCGTVYKAEQGEPVRRKVALKIIKLGMDTKSVIARFESERQALAIMDHPCIAKVFDAGATDTGRPYFVMELVRGMPITQYCDSRKLPTRQRLRLFIQVCNAIQHAHQKGIIHRDIKPSNILVAENDGEATPKIIDFGIAKATEHRLTEMTLFTAVESFIGTPTYMSPEQAEISGLDIDTRSDIYSLGVLLYELLVGQPPFDATEMRELPLDEVRRTIREVEPDRPSCRFDSLHENEIERIADQHAIEPGKLAGVLRGDLDWIVIKCLEKDRSRRYASTTELVADIERHLEAKPVTARPPSTIYRTRKLLKRHGGAIAAGSLLFLTLITGIALSTTQAIRAKRAEEDAMRGKDLQEQLRADAERESNQAKANASQSLLNEYVADINLTQHALSEGNFRRAQQLIDKHLPTPGKPDHRGFEWYYLARLCLGDEHVSLPNDSGSVQCLAFSPNGQTLAVGLRDEIQLWNVRGRTRITRLPGGATSLVFLRDGYTLVSAGSDSTWVVDTSTWREVTELRGSYGPLALSADGSQLATSGDEGIRIWDTNDWFELLNIPGATGPLAFSPDGNKIAATGSGGLTLWSLKDGRQATVLEDSNGLAGESILFSKDGKQLIAPRNSKSEHGVFVMGSWDPVSGKDLGIVPNNPGHTGAIVDLSIAKRNNLMASASWDHSVGLWDLDEETGLRNLSGHRSEIWCVALSPNGRTLASGSKDGEIRLWPTSPKPIRDTVDQSLTPLTFSQESRLIVASDSKSLTFFDLPSLARRKTIETLPKTAISADLGTVAIPFSDGRVEILDPATNEKQIVQVSSTPLDFLALTGDGSTLLTRSGREKMLWWDLSNPTKPAATLSAETAIASSDDQVLAAIGTAGHVEIWGIPEKKFLRTLKVPRSFGSNAALSPDGAKLATTTGSSSSDNLVSIWDTITGELLGVCSGHKQSVRSLAFSADGLTLATASDDGTLKLWNVATRQELLSIRRLGTSLRHLAFSPDGQWLVGGSSPNSPTGELKFFHAPR